MVQPPISAASFLVIILRDGLTLSYFVQLPSPLEPPLRRQLHYSEKW